MQAANGTSCLDVSVSWFVTNESPLTYAIIFLAVVISIGYGFYLFKCTRNEKNNKVNKIELLDYETAGRTDGSISNEKTVPVDQYADTM